MRPLLSLLLAITGACASAGGSPRSSQSPAPAAPAATAPAAFLCPPPPNSLATAPTSIVPFDRMLTRYSSPSSCLKKTAAWISFTVSGRFTRPSVSS